MLKKVRIEEVKINPNNPRVINKAQYKKLKKSLKEFPEMIEARPIVVNPEMYAIGGNMRLMAMQELGVNELTVYIASWGEIKEKEFVVKDNLSYGEWKWDVLQEQYGTEELIDWGVEIPKIELKEVKKVQEDFFDPSKEVKTKIKIGDAIQIGNHRIVCGDTRNPNHMLLLMQGQKADMVLTDPPYNVNYVGKGGKGEKIENDDMDNESFHEFLLESFTTLASVTKDGGAWYVWFASSEALNFIKAFTQAGIMLKQQLMWVKNTFVMGRQDYQWRHEPCLYGWKPGAGHYFTEDRTKSTIWFYDNPHKSDDHPTMKPIALFGESIANSSRENEIVLDGFGGSGTTMVACEQLGRSARIMEFDPKYVQRTINRMQANFEGIVVEINGKPYVKN